MRTNRRFTIAGHFIAAALAHHSDRGSQYVSIKYTECLAEAGIEPSVGSVGDGYDNALAETINGLYKAEVIHRRGPWRSFETVEYATLEWVDWFNHRRLLELIGNIPPAEAEERYHAVLDEVHMAAQLKQTASDRPGAVQWSRASPPGATQLDSERDPSALLRCNKKGIRPATTILAASSDIPIE
jgi:hypothetical protein